MLPDHGPLVFLVIVTVSPGFTPSACTWLTKSITCPFPEKRIQAARHRLPGAGVVHRQAVARPLSGTPPPRPRCADRRGRGQAPGAPRYREASINEVAN